MGEYFLTIPIGEDPPSLDSTHCVVIGPHGKASGIGALAVGAYAEAFGDGATAFGYKTKAHGKGALALGDGVEAIGDGKVIIKGGELVSEKTVRELRYLLRGVFLEAAWGDALPSDKALVDPCPFCGSSSKKET